MVLLPHGPEPCASANSATSAFLLCRFVYISQRHVELYYKTVILSTTFSKKYFLKKFKKVLAKSFRAVVYYNTSVRAEQQKLETPDTRKCRNWQTSKTKDLVVVTSCGFKSHLPHKAWIRKSPGFLFFRSAPAPQHTFKQKSAWQEACFDARPARLFISLF